MIFKFNSSKGLIVVEAEVSGPLGADVLRMALDTGARRTILNPARLATVGHAPLQSQKPIQGTTASGVVSMLPVTVNLLVALGQQRANFVVMSHAIPATVQLDGLLGLDFFRDQVLTIDFPKGEITLNPGQTP